MISNNIKIPGNYYQIDPSLAGFDNSTRKVAIVGQKLPEGSAAVESITQINNLNDVDRLFGKGSELEKTITAFKKKNTNEQLFAVVAENEGYSAIADIRLTLKDTELEGGILTLKVLDSIVNISISGNDTLEKINEKIIEAINKTEEPVTASVEDENDFVTIKSKISGGNGNSLPLKKMDITAKGIEVVVSGFRGGVDTAFSTDIIDLIVKNNINYVLLCQSSFRNVQGFAEKADQLFNLANGNSFTCFVSKNEEVSNKLISFANLLNSPHVVIFDNFIASENSICINLGMVAGEVISLLADDPSYPTGNMKISGLKGSEFRSFDERNLLLNNGISTLDLLPDGTVRLNRCVSSYHTNKQGDVDGAYLDIQTIETLMRIKELRQSTMDKELAGYKLFLNDNDYVEAGIKAITPATLRSWLVNFYQTVLVAEKGWCQDVNNYIKTLNVTKSDDKTRLNYTDQPTLTGGLYITAGVGYFK